VHRAIYLLHLCETAVAFLLLSDAGRHLFGRQTIQAADPSPNPTNPSPKPNIAKTSGKLSPMWFVVHTATARLSNYSTVILDGNVYF